ncbi:hypothetical protein BSKO_06270 [Bryopsis sp. KO-2023]|nr:hypothetical protein BSKO_06270 [Bryopsis sp. KO-2023]
MDVAATVARKIDASKSSGIINLRGEGLPDVPRAVYDQSGAKAGNWWEASELLQLILAHNEIMDLPSAMFQLSTLTVLDLSYNKLSTVPRELCHLTELKTLDVSHNKLAELHACVADLSALAQLSCSHNQLTALPPNLGQNQSRMARLDASRNLLADVPRTLAGAHSLTVLNLEHNKIRSIPGEVFLGLGALVELNLAQNQLSGCVWAEVSALTSLRVLNIRYNQFTELPGPLSGCVKLAELHAAYNKIDQISTELGVLEELKLVDLSNNGLKTIPGGACKMNLNILDLSNNDLTGLPPELGLMTTLRKLPLEGNPLRTIRRELVTGPVSRLLEALRFKLPAELREDKKSSSASRSGNLFGANETELAENLAKTLKLTDKPGDMVLKSLKLTEVPKAVWEAVGNLEVLDLSSNAIEAIDPELLQGAHQLRKLLLKMAGLKSWPLPLVEGCLPVLGELDLCRNRIPSIPANAFVSCANLRELDLSGIAAAGKMIPGTMTGLVNLRRISLPMTTTPEFPKDLLSLPSLNMIDLSSNSITFLPENITKLSNLAELNISNNNIAHLPPRLGLMHPTLKVVMLEGNLLKTIRRPLLEKGTPALLEYLAAKVPF